MLDAAKVLTGLACIENGQGDCTDCPYKKIGVYEYCVNQIAEDAGKLLKSYNEKIIRLKNDRRVLRKMLAEPSENNTK